MNVKIEDDTHSKAIEHCNKAGIKLGFFCTEAVKEKLRKEVKETKVIDQKKEHK